MTTQKCSFNRYIAIALIVALCARLGLLWADHQSVSGEEIGDLVKHDNQTVVVFVDDPKALVVLDPGPDGLPGRAGIDDGGNGTTDERGELGATGSDDVCRVAFAEEADALRRRDEVERSAALAVLIVQRGAYRPLGDSEPSPAGTPTRVLVRWTDDAGRSREMLRDR